ncbi:sulfotransferase family protein [Actinomadura sp. KC06]|uniref:sulfotransferase-like domain-containing protein n=1 Tax=Actinomadura sp. KC06 TaxID=2530369 RepID=UPI00104AF284|nr:sulfotransferase family protein [Actinomadura sp. KC06]TDD37548.1 sulfotransferase family protein [Actinomadura sp. KC06]
MSSDEMAAPAVALWAVPRSVSTALEKSLSQHPEIEPVHEPFTDCYYFSDQRRSDRYGDQPHKLSYGMPDVHTQLQAITAPIPLIKDLCFQAEPYVPSDRLATWTNIFVVRHPARVWLSLSRLKPDFTEDEFGFTALNRMWIRVVEELGHPGRIVEGDRFRMQPKRVLLDLCHWLGLSFDTCMTNWIDGRIRHWSPDERDSQQKWHRVLEGSRGVLPPDPELPPDWEPMEPDPLRRRIYDQAVEVHDHIMGLGQIAGAA